jgi:hypothetical protein
VLSLTAAVASAAPQRPDVSPFTGPWAGGGRFTSEAGAQACEYVGLAEPPSVSVVLEGASGPSGGQVSLDLPAAGASCPALRARYRIEDVRVSGNSVGFADAAGNQWRVTLRDGRLQGMVSSPRFNGEVDLNPASTPPAAPSPAPSPSPGPEAGTAAPVAAPAPQASAATDGKAPPRKGSVWKGVGGVIAANVVGLGALVGLNKALNDSKAPASNTVTCSPRTCVAAAPGDCQCNNNLTNGASCGTTSSGVPYAGVCNPPSLPCQADLSCNNGLCEDRLGRCPF